MRHKAHLLMIYLTKISHFKEKDMEENTTQEAQKTKTTYKIDAVDTYLKANPQASATEVALACNTTVGSVHQMIYQLKKREEKRKAEKKKARLEKTKMKQQPIPLEKSHPNELLVMEVAQLNSRIKNLEHQAIGYRAVIDFLEFQFNRKNGTPV